MLWQLMERLNDNPTAMFLLPLAIIGIGGAIPLALESRRRNSNALMQQGMKMLSGACTLGIDC